MKVLKFSASWCQPCKMLAKTLEDYKGEVPIENIDIDESQEVAIRFGIRGVPTCVLVDDSGVEIKRQSGMMMLNQFEEFLKV